MYVPWWCMVAVCVPGVSALLGQSHTESNQPTCWHFLNWPDSGVKHCYTRGARADTKVLRSKANWEIRNKIFPRAFSIFKKRSKTV